jgi:hypothetical protein
MPGCGPLPITGLPRGRPYRPAVRPRRRCPLHRADRGNGARRLPGRPAAERRRCARFPPAFAAARTPLCRSGKPFDEHRGHPPHRADRRGCGHRCRTGGIGRRYPADRHAPPPRPDARAGDNRRRHPAAVRPSRLRHPRPAHRHHRNRLRPAAAAPCLRGRRRDPHPLNGYRRRGRQLAGGDPPGRATTSQSQRGGAGHRCTRTAAVGPADPRRPAHRPAARHRAPAPAQGRLARCCRRRPTGQLVGGHDPEADASPS